MFRRDDQEIDVTGADVPYHLRTRKAVDRSAFMDALRLLSASLPISSYTYVGFGASSLEDFKQIHTDLGIKKMISLEVKANAHLRQKFNQPVECIECLNKSSSQYLTDFKSKRDEAENFVIWLDYTNSDLASQLQDIQSVILSAESGDVLRVTLNASPSSLLQNDSLDPEELRTERLRVLRDKVGQAATAKLTSESMEVGKYPNSLCRVVRYYFSQAMVSRPDLRFEAICVLAYADGQQMLTFTGIFAEPDQDIFAGTSVKSWDLYSSRIENPIMIDVPDLTLRERMAIDRLLPKASVADLKSVLGGFSVADRQLEAYKRFYRYMWHYSRVTY